MAGGPSRVETAVRRLIRLRAVALGLLALLTAGAATRAVRLSFDFSFRNFLLADHRTNDLDAAIAERFGNVAGNFLVAVLEGDDAFRRDVLTAVATMAEAAERIPHVDRVFSLATVPYVHAEGGDLSLAPINQAIGDGSVDDDPTFADAVRTCLAGPEMRCSAEVVGTGEDALAYLERRPPFLEAHPPAFVVLDHRLPDTDGATIVRWIRDHTSHRRMPILVLSQAISPLAADAVLDAGADDVKLKPAARGELLELLAQFVVERVAQQGNGA